MEYLVESALLTPGLIMGKSGSGISMSFLNLEAGQPLIQELTVICWKRH